MSDRTSSGSADYVLLTRLADEFAARYRAGERPSLQEYIDRHPALAEDIRELFPAMVEIEIVKEDHQEVAEQAAAPVAPALRQLGDFRILREVGKGGMGIVYEAEQVSLGRHVALKVLPRNMLLDTRAKRRFEREAKSAARLHHTNIVPVFGVGEQDGMPYYVMQFIQGLGLDEVLEELKKSQPSGHKASSLVGANLAASQRAEHASDGPGEATERKARTRVAVSAADMARSLLTGEFHSPLDQDADATMPATVAEAHEQGRDAVVATIPATSDSFTSSTSSVVLPGQGRDGSKSKRKRRSYWQSVASIGVQVAEAMEYAHKQGIHHRDIKPSNLLLDSQGTVWVTDFGLAKADDQQNLTHTGDILGTLRYMPPEAFEGRTDARSDVYSLGLTLYEMLAFRAAFDEKERNRLIKQVTESDPVRLGKLNRKVPQDLETIVHKAIDKEPRQRYASAGALAEDLQRFIDDQPIRARQIGAAERYWRWARRNPVIATLGGVLTAVLTVGLVVMSVLWSRAERSARIAQSLATKEATARAEAQALARDEAAARKESQALAEKEAKARAEADAKAEQLAREDYVNRVNRAYREVQNDNVALAEDLLHGCPPERRGWEWRYVERLCNSARRIIDVGNNSVSALAYSPDGTRAVSGWPGMWRGRDRPTVTVFDVNSGQPYKALPGARDYIYDLAYSPDGQRVAAGCSSGLVLVWDVATGQSAWTRKERELEAMSVAFSPDGKSLAAGYGGYSGAQFGRVKVWDVASGEELKAFAGPKGGVNKLAFHPDGKRLAVAGSEVVEVWNLESARKVMELKGHRNWVYGLAYSPDGKWLASGGWDNTVKLRDAETGTAGLTFHAHEGFVLSLAFSPDGRSLATTGEDRSVRLWEVPSGRRLATFPGHSDFVQAVAFRPDGREIATGSLDGSIRFWDLRTSRPVVIEHSGRVSTIALRRDGRRVITGFGTDLKVWDPFTGDLDSTAAGIRFEALPKDFVPSNGGNTLASPDGKLIAQAIGYLGWSSMPSRSKEYSSSSVTIRDSRTGGLVHTLTGHSAQVTSIGFSPDGRRLATASFDRTVKLWDMQTGKEVFTLLGHAGGVDNLAFSPDGDQIITVGIDGTARVWNATPLGSNVTAEHDARYRKKIETLARLNEETDALSRGKILADNSQWGMAAEAFARAAAKEPDNLQNRLLLIDALVQSGDSRRARPACDAMFKRFETSSDPFQALTALAVYRLIPQAATEPEKRQAVHNLATAQSDPVRVSILARAGQWDLLAQSLAKILEDQPGNLWIAHWHFVALLEVGNIPEYRAAAARTLLRYRKATEPNTLYRVAQWCTHIPDAVADLAVPVQMAEAAMAGYPADLKPNALGVMGAALYRAGRLDEAIERLEASVKTRVGSDEPADWVFLAMAHHKVGHGEEARRWLAKVRAIVNDEKTANSTGFGEILRSLLKEAEAVLREPPPARP